MNINGVIINTPYDVFPEYDQAWRHLVAKALIIKSGTIIPEEIRADSWIRDHMAYLIQAEKKDSPRDKKLAAHKTVLSWYSGGVVNSMKSSIEALLLTEATYELITRDMLSEYHDPKLIQLYERLFFDCRNEDGTPATGAFRRRWLAIPQDGRIHANTFMDIYWKVVAYQSGYAGLITSWRLAGYHGTGPTMSFHMEGLRNCVIPALLERIVRDNISNRDLVEALKNVLEYDKQVVENKSGNSLAEESFKSLIGVLQVVMPTKFKQAIDAETLKELNDGWQAKREVSEQMGGQGIVDNGTEAALEGLARQVQAHMSVFNKDESAMRK